MKKLLVKLLISVILLSWFLHQTNLHEVWLNLKAIPTIAIIISLLLFLIAHAISTYKWQILLPKSNYLRLLKYVFIAQYYSLILPGQLAGEAMKIYLMGKGQKNAEQIAVSVFFDRMTGFSGLLFFSLGGIYLSRKQIPPALIIFNVIMVIGLCVVLFSIRVNLFFRLINKILDWAQDRFVSLNKIVGQITCALEAWRFYLRRRDLLISSLLLALTFQFLCILISIILAGGLGIYLPFADWCWVLGVVSIAVVLPVTVGGIGLREGAFIALLGFLGVPAAQSLALSVTIFFLTICGAAVGGICEWIRISHEPQRS